MKQLLKQLLHLGTTIIADYSNNRLPKESGTITSCHINTFSFPTCQLWLLGQCPSASEHDDLGIPLTSVP